MTLHIPFLLFYKERPRFMPTYNCKHHYYSDVAYCKHKPEHNCKQKIIILQHFTIFKLQSENYGQLKSTALLNYSRVKFHQAKFLTQLSQLLTITLTARTSSVCFDHSKNSNTQYAQHFISYKLIKGKGSCSLLRS